MHTLPTPPACTSSLPEVTSHLASGHPLRQPHRRACLKARVQTPRQEQQSESSGDCSPSYPAYEETTAQDGFLPKRQPGQFPDVRSDSLRSRLRKLPVAEQVLDSLLGTNVALAEGAVFDPLRDGPLRYLGYANECGEAFAAWLPLWGVPASYAVAVGYVVTDTIDKGFKAYAQASEELEGNESLPSEVNAARLTKILALERAMDTIVWQLLASVICPGYTIHTIVWLAHLTLVPVEALAAVQGVAESAAGALHTTADSVVAIGDKSLPTAIGLAGSVKAVAGLVFRAIGAKGEVVLANEYESVDVAILI
ncbi:hypothetical protein WJX84_000268 [Apatococcus fuscideae]|uniref:Mitochondrial fission process protein 1 n=1 Tax=Apatococcus fuscideae TaxID=2026836 RepID=A0AAW1T739_9CHLO